MLLPLLLAAAQAALPPAYLRYPDLHGQTVVFTADGDLWLAPVRGGLARRLTAHPGEETCAHFSPDGRWIAFSAHYEGDTDVYVLPVEGGEPRRLTWHPADEEVVGWWPDGSRIIFRSRRGDFTGRSDWVFTVPVEGGEVERVPIGWAANLAVDPDSGRFAFNRINRDHRSWKRYRGGMAQDIWVGSPERADYRKVTDFEGTDAFPMWHDGRIFFLSDKGGTANLWSMKPDGSDRRRLTDEHEWDLRWPAMAPDGRIVAMRGGDLVLWDPADGQLHPLEIEVPVERNLARHRYAEPQDYLEWYAPSPDGERVLVVTRGELFALPVEDGPVLPLTNTSGARESWASYSPDGERVLYVTDATGEQAIVTADAWGRGEPTVVVPPGESRWIFPPQWSPDGEWIAWSDQSFALWVAPADGSGEARLVDRSPQAEITVYAWSPDGRWLAYDKKDRRQYSSVYVYDTRSGQSHAVTGPNTVDYYPAWDPEGRYLYFLSHRELSPFFGERDFEYVVWKTTRIYAALLRPDVENPLLDDAGLPPAGEDTGKKGKKARKKDKEKTDEEEAPKPVEIDFDGIEQRVVALPVERGRYSGLRATADRLFYLSFDVDALYRGEKGAIDLRAWSWEDEESQTFVSGISSYELSGDGKKLLFTKDGELYAVGADAPPDDDALSDGHVSWEGVVLELDPREEWRQIFYEAWRLERDFYWDPGMGGVDWEAQRDKYAALLPRISTRGELNDLLGELIGELATSHTYRWGGDPGVELAEVPTGLLGAELVREGPALKVVRIYRGDPADRVRSPLDEPGSQVREGEYIQAVDHRPIPQDRSWLSAFAHRAGVPVLLTVSDRPEGGHQREVVVTPLSGERDLRYADWVRRNREYVSARTDGRVGYLHLPDMGIRGLTAFETWFYPQLDRKALIVDVRWNSGGFVSQLVLERLRRGLLGYDRSRGGGVWTYPDRVLNGPFVVLTNEFAGSDGDIFPTAVQIEGLAPVIGERSWGGVIGIRGDKPLVDGGMLTEPEYAFNFPSRGGWVVENHGVDPDIEVQLMPQDWEAGRDPQLDRAIEEVLELREQGEAEGRWPEPDFGPVPPRDRRSFEQREGGD